MILFCLFELNFSPKGPEPIVIAHISTPIILERKPGWELPACSLMGQAAFSGPKRLGVVSIPELLANLSVARANYRMTVTTCPSRWRMVGAGGHAAESAKLLSLKCTGPPPAIPRGLQAGQRLLWLYPLSAVTRQQTHSRSHAPGAGDQGIQLALGGPEHVRLGGRELFGCV